MMNRTHEDASILIRMTSLHPILPVKDSEDDSLVGY